MKKIEVSIQSYKVVLVNFNFFMCISTDSSYATVKAQVVIGNEK